MKIFKSNHFSKIMLIFSILTITSSCSERSDTVSCFPRTTISVILNLNLQPYFNNLQQRGWTYINEQQSGEKGLILVQTAPNRFMVYDRNPPHICPDSNTTLEVKNDIAIVCPKDGAEWILRTGQPTKVAKTAPKTYPYNYDQSTNTISIFYN